MTDSSTANTTPLHALHVELGGKLVDFAGTLLPLSYAGGGMIAEHSHTRTAASLFDVSHMGQLRLRRSPAADAALAALVPANLSAIAAGGARYTLLTTADGGVIDDCIITNDGDEWFIVVNASRKEVDIAHFNAALAAADAGAVEELPRGLLAVQGPAAAEVVSALFPSAAALTFMQSAVVDSAYGDCRLSRCGYTGEDGFEISVAADQAEALARALLAGGVCKPAGLGARDSLRLEAGLCLYGNELAEDITPIEAGLLWTIPKSRRGADAGYNGAAVIAGEIDGGAKRRLTGLLPQGKTPVRQGAALTLGGAPAGAVTSGLHSPTLQYPIAIALVPADVPADAMLAADVRGREVVCNQCALPFVPHRYHRG